MKRIGLLWFALYVASIYTANWAIQTIGMAPVGFGLLAPAGVYAAGFTFAFRDFVQDTLGRGWTLGAIVVGTALSAFVSPQFALASGLAFLVSETADMAVYTPLRKRGWFRAVVASNVVGYVVDSVLFLGLAFGSQEFLLGQIIGKSWTLLPVMAGLWLLRRRAH